MTCLPSTPMMDVSLHWQPVNHSASSKAAHNPPIDWECHLDLQEEQYRRPKGEPYTKASRLRRVPRRLPQPQSSRSNSCHLIPPSEHLVGMHESHEFRQTDLVLGSTIPPERVKLPASPPEPPSPLDEPNPPCAPLAVQNNLRSSCDKEACA